MTHLQMAAAELLLVTGLGTMAEAARGDGATGRAVDWAPAMLGTAAALAHAAYAVAPSERRRRAVRALDAGAIGMGLVSLGRSVSRSRRMGRPLSVSSIPLASAGLLGLVLDRSEQARALAQLAAERERERLERRASIVERILPRRKEKVDRIVVHV